eukprot:1990648-Amphidinium_carterae.1
MAASSVVDTRGLSKVPHHDGRDETWPEFCFKFENYVHLLGWGDMVETYVRQDIRDLDALGQLGHPPPCSRSAWTRSLGSDFMEVLVKWEYQIAQYELSELTSGERLSDSIRIAIVLEHAPARLRDVARQTPEGARRTYAGLKAFLKEYVYSGKAYTMTDDGGTIPTYLQDDPMQVDQVWKGKAGKGKQKGKSKGKDKGQGKGKNQGKDKGGKDSSSSGGKPSSKGDPAGGANAYFNGECGYCGVWGHKRSQCRKRMSMENRGQQQGGQSGQDGGVRQATAEELEGSRSIAQVTESNWVFAVAENPVVDASSSTDSSTFILVDSGSDEHMCNENFAP